MAPKKQTRSRTNKTEEPSATARSTASIFRDVDVEDPAVIEKLKGAEETNIDEEEETNEVEEEEEEDDVKEAVFLLKIVYTVQDFLNETMTFVKFAQILVFAYLLEILYLKRDRFELLDDSLPTVGFNAMGVAIGLISSYMKAPEIEGDVKAYPEFEYIYSGLLPLLLSSSHFESTFFLANLSLNYYFIDRLHLLFSLLSSVVFFHIYNESADVSTALFFQLSSAHLALTYVFNKINESNLLEGKKSFKKAEIQLASSLLVNILFNQDLLGTSAYLPLVILQKLIISSIAAISLAYPVFDIVPSFALVPVFGGVFYALTIFQLQPVLKENALVWIYNYIVSDPENLQIVQVWVAILSVSIPVIFYCANSWSLNFRRKIWHFVILVVLLFNSKILIEKVELTLIALFGASVVFILVEVLRVNQYTPLGRFLHAKLSPFQDSKDLQGPFNMSYIYLVIGVTIPIVYDYINGNGKVTIVRYMGLISLGLGDSLASIVGKQFGSIKWRGAEKSLQGTIAFVVATLGSFMLLDKFLSEYSPEYSSIKNWENLLVATLLGAVLEGSSSLNDNYVVPIILPVAYEILNKSF